MDKEKDLLDGLNITDVSPEKYLEGQDYPSLEELREQQEKRGFSGGGYYSSNDQEMTEAEKAYRRKLQMGFTPVKEDHWKVRLEKLLKENGNGRPKLLPCKVEFKEAKEEFLKVYGKMSKYPIETDGNLSQVLNALIRHFIGDPSGPYDVNKGIYLFGKVGLGKTTIMESFSLLTQALKYNYFRLENVRNIGFTIEREKDSVIMDSFMVGSWCFDDLFADTGDSKFYGNAIDVSQTLVEQFYIHGWQRGQKMHVTTNIEPEEISSQVADPRFLDRIKEMMTIVEITGKSKRK